MIFGPFLDFFLSNEAAEEVDKAASTRPRIYEEMQGVEWVLVRSPEKGVAVAPGLYVYANSKATRTASLIVLVYTYDQEKVEVLRIWIS